MPRSINPDALSPIALIHVLMHAHARSRLQVANAALESSPLDLGWHFTHA